MNEKFLKPYNHIDTEDALYKKWEESGLFNPDVCIEKDHTNADAEPFSIMLPPPNVTGTLHTGHAYMLVIEDIMTRFARMQGKRTLWLPGTDHASIATQSKVEKELAKKKIRKDDLGREKFLKEVTDFAQASHDTIVGQVRKMGSSIDWSREAYTLDDTRSYAVRYAFKNMYDAGLIYRGDRIVNWDTKGQTTISDDEIIYEEEQTTFYYFQYGPFVIGTSRPETKFGDKYVVMHPDDKRYAEYTHGQEIEVEWINGPITTTIIKDTAIDMEFGTGVMTITPWHSIADFDIAERHNLKKEQIISTYGKMLPIAGECAGLKIAEAREKVVEILRKKGLVVKEEPYTHNIATAERTGGIIEPQIMRQWFVDVNKQFPIPHSNITGIKTGDMVSLKEIMTKAIENKDISILPERFNKTYFHWINNLRDWCISRQIWYGHQIPVWYRGDEVYVGTEAPESTGWEQDPDTLDTWFSSGLWTFSTLGWPEQTSDLATYHPTTIIETGYDIIFFWIARMILMSGFHVGTIPFKTVYLHGLVRDASGRKMSKSLGNVVNPLDFIEKYGADALRMGLIIGSGPGNDTNLSEDNIRGYRKFSNKVWNIARFVLESVADFDHRSTPEILPTHAAHISEWKKVLADITADCENYRLYLAAEKIYQYIWHTFADIIIEESKADLATTGETRISAQYMLYSIFTEMIATLHPFMPFLTEEIWQSLPHTRKEFLMVEKWPK